MPAIAAASTLAMMGVFDFFGTIASGWLSDRYDNRALLFWYYGLRGLSLLYLPFSAFSFYGLSLFGAFYGLDWIATVPPTVRLSARAFGKEKAGVAFGWIFAAHQLGAATAAFGAGLSRSLLAQLPPGLLRRRRHVPCRRGDRLADPEESGGPGGVGVRDGVRSEAGSTLTGRSTTRSLGQITTPCERTSFDRGRGGAPKSKI